MIENFNDLKDFVEHKDDLRSQNPWHVIKESAKQMGIILQQPKSNCKHCHGRGYIGLRHENGEPIPCRCIFPKTTNEDVGDLTPYLKPKNRAERRAKKRG